MEGNVDFTDFYAILQKYLDTKLKYKQVNQADIHRNQLSNPLDILDEIMFDKIVENLFRLLMDDLFIEKETDQQVGSQQLQKSQGTIVFGVFHGSDKFLKSKINLMKVLFEMLSLVESKGNTAQNDHSNFEQLNENPIYKKMVNESSFFIMIFTDLTKHLSM